MKMIIYGCGVACTILFVFFSLSKAPIKHNKLHEQNSESDLSQQRLSLPDDESLNRSDWVNDQDITQIWSEIRPLLLEKKTRTVGIARALEVRGFPAFFLTVVDKELALSSELTYPLSHLLRIMLHRWHDIPGENFDSFPQFLSELFSHASASNYMAKVAAKEWKDQRLLNPIDSTKVYAVRPPSIDASKEKGLTQFFLYLLQDLFYSFTENAQSFQVEVFLDDPSQEIRVIALQVLLDGKPSSRWAQLLYILDGVPHTRISELAAWVAKTQPPEQAASLIEMLCIQTSSPGGFLPAWIQVGAKDMSVLLKMLHKQMDLDDLLLANGNDFPDDPSGVTQGIATAQLFHDYGLKRELLDAYFLNSISSGEPMDLDILNWFARLDKNPISRAQAWRMLGRSGDRKGVTIALELIEDPNYRSSLRLPDQTDDSQIADYLQQYIAPQLSPEEQIRLEAILSRLTLPADDSTN